MANFCTSCGKPLGENATFCTNCGAAVQQQTPPAQSAPPNYTGNPYQGYPGYPQQVVYVKAKVPGRGFGISSLVLGIIGLIYGVVVFMSMVIAKDMMDFVGASGSHLGAMETDVKLGVCTGIMVYAVMSILAICFAIPAKKRGYCNGVQKSGMVTGVIGLALYLISICYVLTL